MTQRTFTELQQCLDTGTQTLLDALRGAGDGERAFRQSQVDAAVRFCAKVFGQEYASLLTKAAERRLARRRRKAAASLTRLTVHGFVRRVEVLAAAHDVNPAP